MDLISSSELADMIAAAEASLNDLCTLLAKTGSTTDEYSQVIDTYTTYEEVPCGFLTKEEFQNERGQIVTLDADALLRVSLDQAVSARDVVICRDMRFDVDGVVDGRTVRIVSLKQTATEE